VTASDLGVDDRALERLADRDATLWARSRVERDREQTDLQPRAVLTDQLGRMSEAAFGAPRPLQARTAGTRGLPRSSTR